MGTRWGQASFQEVILIPEALRSIRKSRWNESSGEMIEPTSQTYEQRSGLKKLELRIITQRVSLMTLEFHDGSIKMLHPDLYDFWKDYMKPRVP